jgi:hypothetical protein
MRDTFRKWVEELVEKTEKMTWAPTAARMNDVGKNE